VHRNDGEGELPHEPGTDRIQVEWEAPNRIRIVHHRDLRVFRNDARSHGVSIEYAYLQEEPGFPRFDLAP
jgi:hypothetical protein